MGKNKEINFVGQPILKQLMGIVTAIDIKGIIREKQSDRYYKSFGSMTQLVTMLFGIFSRCDSMTEVCGGLRGMGGKLSHLGLKKSPAKSTASDGLRNRDSFFFEAVYFSLVKHYHSFLSDSRTFGLTFKEVLLVDSTTIRLFSDILKGVGRNPKGDGKKKGGLKVHMLIDAVQSVGRFVKITEARVHDKNFLSVWSWFPIAWWCSIRNERLRQSIESGDDKALAAEEVGKNWLPYNDMFLALQVSRERYAGVSNWRTIPLFQSAYHEYAITFGNYSSLLSPPYDEMWPPEKTPADAETPLPTEFNQQFLMEQARSYVWRMQPMIASYQPELDTLRKTEMTYVRRLATVRRSGLKYFLHGEYLPSLALEVPQENIIISKLSIYAGQNEQVTRFEDQYPTVYHSAWLASDQSDALAFASIQEKAYPVRYTLQAQDYRLAENGRLFLVSETGRENLGAYHSGLIKLDFDLPARGVVYLELVPDH